MYGGGDVLVYISGKITGLSRDTYLAKFKTAEQLLFSMGHTPVNPAAVNDRLPVVPYSAYIEMSITMLRQCNAIYMLADWTESQGAAMELKIAQALGLTVMYEEELEVTEAIGE